MDDAQKTADALHRASHGDNPDAVWDGLINFAQALAKMRGEVAAARHERRLAKRRERYALDKKLGRLPQRQKPEPEPVSYYEPPTGCYCAATSRPPCSWCENYSEEDGA